MKEEDIRTHNITDIWKKYFSKTSNKCTDCDGMSLQVCEKVLREFFTAIFKRMDKHTEDKVRDAHNKAIDNAIQALPEGKPIYRNATNPRDKSIFDASNGFNSCREETIINLNKLKI